MAKNGQFWSWARKKKKKTLINATLKRIIETSGDVSADNLYSEPDTVEARQVVDAEIIMQGEPAIIQQGEPTETAQPKTFTLE